MMDRLEFVRLIDRLKTGGISLAKKLSDRMRQKYTDIKTQYAK